MAEFLTSNPAIAIAGIIALGAAAQWLAWRVNLPAILPLLVVGFVVGPLLGWLDPTAVVGDSLLFPSVGLAVGLILFEGGLTLALPEVRETRGVVLRLVTIGALMTWIGATAAAHWLVGLPLPMAFLFGALVIVTGPTVIGPLLRIVRPEARVGNLLKWEGILIDAIGAMVAVLTFEFLLIDTRELAMGRTLLLFVQFVVIGSITGVISGTVLAFVLRRRWVPDYLINLVALAFVFATFAFANALAPEAGLLATVLMGMVVSNMGVPNIRDILSFKEDMTILFISLLFIVLAANVQLDAFLAVLTLESGLLLLFLMLVLRPLAVIVSTSGSSLEWREKVFLGWIAPRGIVAAAVSSLFASRLINAGFNGADQLVPLVFLVIVGTVLVGSVTASPMARLLGLAEPNPKGFLILGAHSVARKLGAFLKEQGLPVQLADTNWSNVAAARVEGLPAYYGSLLSDHSDDELRLSGIGRLLALTSNDEANALTCLKYAREFGSQSVFQLQPGRANNERGTLSDEQRGRILFRRPVTYRELQRLVDRGAELKKTELTEKFTLTKYQQRYGDGHLPLFVLENKSLRVLTADSTAPEAGSRIVSLVLPDEAEAAE